MSAPGFRVTRLLLAAAVVLLAAGVYANTLSNGFALDDQGIILENERAHGVEHLGEALTSQYWPGGPARAALYRPLTVASFAVDWELWGSDPAGFHAVNVGLHALVTLLVFLLLLELGLPPGAAAAGAALFAVHPVHTEAVANIVGRAELLAAIGFLATCILYLRRRAPAAIRLPGIALGFLIALGSKEIAVTLPLVLVLLEVFRRQSGEEEARLGRGADPALLLRRLVGQAPAYLVLTAAAATYAAFRYVALGELIGNDVAPALDGMSTPLRIANGMRIWPEYARLLFVPLELVADYSPAVILPVEGVEASVIAGAIIGLLAITVTIASWREEPLLAAAVLWFAVTVFPVSNLVIPVGVLLAERTLYLPSVALALGAAVLVRRLHPTAGRAPSALLLAGALVLALAGWRTWERNPVWHSTHTVMQDLVERHPESYHAQWAVGRELVRRGDVTSGLELYRSAAQLVPGHYSLILEYGNVLLALGRPAEAEPWLRRALDLIPEHAESYTSLVRCLLDQHRPHEAFRVAAEGLRLHSDDPGLYELLARSHALLENRSAAANAFQAAAYLAPDTASTTPRHGPRRATPGASP